MNENELAKMIKRHEGYRPAVYKDSLGILTCGYGHALHETSPVPAAASVAFFEADFKEAMENYESLNFDLDPVRRAVVVDMLFNLGIGKFMGFRKTIAAIRSKNFAVAKKEMLNSLWAKQVGARAVELAGMMETGKVTK